MSLEDSLSDLERSKLAVWDYPVSDEYTKVGPGLIPSLTFVYLGNFFNLKFKSSQTNIRIIVYKRGWTINNKLMMKVMQH